MIETTKMFIGITLLILPAGAFYLAYDCMYSKVHRSEHYKTALMATTAFSLALILLSIVGNLLVAHTQLRPALMLIVRFFLTGSVMLMTVSNMYVVMFHKKQSDVLRQNVVSIVLFSFAMITLGIGLVM